MTQTNAFLGPLLAAIDNAIWTEYLVPNHEVPNPAHSMQIAGVALGAVLDHLDKHNPVLTTLLRQTPAPQSPVDPDQKTRIAKALAEHGNWDWERLPAMGTKQRYLQMADVILKALQESTDL